MSKSESTKYRAYRENLKDTTDNYDTSRYELEHYGFDMSDDVLSKTMEAEQNRMTAIKDLKSKLHDK